MCGIIGYVGPRPCREILVDGLKRLEYRGYDSAGIALITDEGLAIRKDAGRISVLEGILEEDPIEGIVGIAHTRWATHGIPTQRNAHPHTDGKHHFAIVHNGIIENYSALKARLERNGSRFETDTDTEVLVHLLAKSWNGNLEESVATALKAVDGTFGIAVVSDLDPGKVIGARRGSPLVVGIGSDEYFLASDVSAILSHTKHVVYLDDGEMVVLTRDGYRTQTLDEVAVVKAVEEITWELSQIEKSGFPHFMLKEIFEQPRALMDAFRGRIDPGTGETRLGGLNLSADQIKRFDRIVLLACGTSWHAALIGEYMLEEICRIPVEVEYASEFRYRKPVIDDRSLVIAISQSGETADTLAALREAKKRGARVLGICNVVGSTIARESDGGIYTHAGPEIGVASTKAFTTQLAVLVVLTVHLARLRGQAIAAGNALVRALVGLPSLVERCLEGSERIREIAEVYHKHNNFLYLGRGYNFPVALEGALKLKEISYIHAEGYPAAEMKHGPIALIDQNMPVVFICTRDSAYEKILHNMEEVRSRKGRIIAVATEGDDALEAKADHLIYIPQTLDPLIGLLSVIPLQLLAYHMAVRRGCNVDQPRNLAKSVTVE
ncbi:MAG: glutamine--fructose-6-phosphate transaminase (isomerizing) [Candidatus Eisenbacteria bacterium]|nr:glutamine--fructose-6-phosphate transaminase (isomerizing) [Candidatus Latescibacterota bacterium]MBD3301031.1 glutamine--fructose-6-phosphate transaminase (isomerizing) [Candidatus Eisenbacteria bacterium]